MRTYRDAKAMARALKTALAEKDIALSHGACLDIVAAQFARDNWNVLAAEIDAADDGRPAPPAAPRWPAGSGRGRAASSPPRHNLPRGSAMHACAARNRAGFQRAA